MKRDGIVIGLLGLFACTGCVGPTHLDAAPQEGDALQSADARHSPDERHSTEGVAQDSETGPSARRPIALTSPFSSKLTPAGLSVHPGGFLGLNQPLHDSRNTRDSDLRLDRAVLRLDAKLEDDWTLRIAPDLIGTDTRYHLEEAWLSFHPDDALRITAGLLEVPLGFEFGFSEDDLPLIGYGFSSYVDARTDVGLRIEGEFEQGALYYDVAATAGVGYDLFGQKRKGPQYSARVVTYPLRPVTDSLLEGLFLGASYAYLDDFEGDLDIATPLRNKLFDSSTFKADHGRFLHFTAGADAGPVRIVTETILGESGFFSGSGFFGTESPNGQTRFDQVGTWEASGSILLTGQHYDSRPFRQRASAGRRRTPFDADESSTDLLGIVEVVVRYSNADIDRELFFAGLVDDRSSQEFRTFAAAVHWYPYATADAELRTVWPIRVTAQVVRTLADQDPAAFDSDGNDTSFALRAQWTF